MVIQEPHVRQIFLVFVAQGDRTGFCPSQSLLEAAQLTAVGNQDRNISGIKVIAA